MTSTDITATESVVTEPAQAWVRIDRLIPHPDNPRRTLGDLSELTRSVKAHGVLMPILVLPADAEGVHHIVAGHRRHAAAVAADVAQLPVIIRDMTEVEVVEAMLVENEHRGELTVAEQITAVERLMSLEDGLTPTKLNKRIGKSKAWVRTRMALAVLPIKWRERIDAGDLTVAAAEAATTVADLGPEHLDAVLDRLTECGGWQDPGRVVEGYRRDLERDAAYQSALERAARRKGAVVFSNDKPPPDNAKPVRDVFDADDLVSAHRKEPCHATVVRRVSWGDGVDTVAVCTNPRSHRPGKPTEGSIESDRTSPNRNGDDSAAKRKGRVARTAFAAELLGRTRGAPSRADLTTFALRALIHDSGQEPIKYAATALGIEDDNPRAALLALADDGAAGLVKVAAAIACGLAEGHMYWSAGSVCCQDYLTLLCDGGWAPDDWTAAHIGTASHDQS